MKKISKEKRDKIIIGSCIGVMASAFLGMSISVLIDNLVVFNYNKAMKYNTTHFTTAEEVINAAKEAIDKKYYCTVLTEVQDNENYTDEDGTEYSGSTTTYTYKTDKEHSETMYSFVDQNIEDSSLLEYWTPTSEENVYNVYIWSTETHTYVKTSTDKGEPVVISTWEILDNLENYKLANDSVWGEQKEPCYVLETYGTNSEYTIVGQYLYISKITSLPMGILTVGAKYDEDEYSYNEDGTIDIQREISANPNLHVHTDDCEHEDENEESHIESIVRMSYSWGNTDFINIPKVYYTEEEFLNAVED